MTGIKPYLDIVIMLSLIFGFFAGAIVMVVVLGDLLGNLMSVIVLFVVVLTLVTVVLATAFWIVRLYQQYQKKQSKAGEQG